MKKGIGILSCAIGLFFVVFGIVRKVKEHTVVSVIGGADGPTSVFIAGKSDGSLTNFLMLAGIILLAVVLIAYFKRKR